MVLFRGHLECDFEALPEYDFFLVDGCPTLCHGTKPHAAECLMSGLALRVPPRSLYKRSSCQTTMASWKRHMPALGISQTRLGAQISNTAFKARALRAGANQ